MIKVKKKLILELLMGDPLTSFQMNQFGVSIGTSLGRISSYIFNTFNDNSELKDKDVIININDVVSDDNKDLNGEIMGKYYVFSSYQEEPVTGLNLVEGKLNALIGLRKGIVFDVVNYSILDCRSISGQRTELDRLDCRRQILQDHSLIFIIGSQTIRIFNLSGPFPFYSNVSYLNSNKEKGKDDNYKLIKSDLKDEENSNEKPNNSNNYNICNTSSKNNDNNNNNNNDNKEEEEEDVNNIFYSNLMCFKYPHVLSVGYELNGREKNLYIYKIIENNNNNTNNNSNKDDKSYCLKFENRIVIDRKVHMVTQCNKWNDYIILVNDLNKLVIYKMNNNTYNIYNKKKLNYDILSINCNFEEYFLILTKDSKINIFNEDLKSLLVIDLSPSTFELGWNYSLVNYRNVISYNCDEGVYLFKLPKFNK